MTVAHPAAPPRGAVSACRGFPLHVLVPAPREAVPDVDLVYLSTRYYLDPAVASLPDADTELLFVRGIAYAGAEDTGGFVPEAIVPSLIRRRRYGAAVEALVARSLWLPASGDRGQPGYRIARWREWQEELEALARRRANDRERKKRERDRKAALDAGPPRQRGRPPAKPQVKNMSRDVSAGSSADSPLAYARGSDFDFDQSVVDQVSQSSVRNARARKTDDDVIAAAIEAVREREKRDITAEAAAAAAAKALARRKGKPLTSRAAWVKTVIANEPDLYADLLAGETPELRVVLDGFAEARPPVCREYVHDPATGVCRDCEMPRSNQVYHREAS